MLCRTSENKLVITHEFEINPDVRLDECGFLIPFLGGVDVEDFPEGLSHPLMGVIMSFYDDYKEDYLIELRKKGKLDWMKHTGDYLLKLYNELGE